MQGSRDPYTVLGVARDADANAIKSAYRKLAQQLHPDRNPDDPQAEEEFKRVSQAYAVLSDPESRRSYDEFGEISLDPNFDAEKARSFGGAFGGGQPGFGGGQPGFGGGGFGSLFEDLFSGGFQARPQPGPDLQAQLELDFLEAARGTERRLSVNRPNGRGGTRRDTLSIKIPAGVADGAKIRLAGKGGEGAAGAPPGDLFATVRVRPHRVFRRDGQDLHIEVPISVREAVTGADIEIPTLDGRVTLHVPPESDGGSRLRLRGKGFPAAGKKAVGDLYVTLRIRVPKGVDAERRAELERLLEDDTDLRSDLFRD